ncbi:hypothetical protein [Glycomyces artemisiae]|nr:hypothetical protein [Glycomyces artemisiae]
MNKPFAARLVAALAIPSLLLAPPAAFAQDDADPGYQTAEESLREDLALTAEALGWTFEEAEAQHRVAQALDGITSAIAAERLDALVGTALSERPGGIPTLYIKGEADEVVLEAVRASGQEVVIADGQRFSFLELRERNRQLNRELVALGYADLSSGVDITTGTISAEVAAQPGLPTDPEAIVRELSGGLQDGVALDVVGDLGNTVQYTYGGLPAYAGVNFTCTTGWSVVDENGVGGTTSAGHCQGLTGTWTSETGTVSLDFQAQHRGTWGDVEWHTTTAQIDRPEFYSSANKRRDTLSIERWWEVSVGESICVFGRKTDVRRCSIGVQNVFYSCTLEGYLTESMIRMKDAYTVKGDSGGGWSYQNRAFGSHVGLCGGKSVFTLADDLDHALGVTVLLKE